MCWREICNAKHTYAHWHTHTILTKQVCVQFLKKAKHLLQEMSWKYFKLKNKNKKIWLHGIEVKGVIFDHFFSELLITNK